MTGARGLRRARVAAFIACVLVTMSACQLDIELETTIDRDGSGALSLAFFVDKELLDLARNSGQDTFTTLCNIPDELERKGWSVVRSTEGGALRISLERGFSGPSDLGVALGDLRTCLSSRTGSTAPFFDLRVRESSSFFRRTTSVEGSVDLTTGGLLAQTNLAEDVRRQVQGFIAQAGNQFFDLTLTATLPGTVNATEGDPTDVRGGTVEWSPQLGTRLAFRAASSAYDYATLGLIAGPLLLIAAIVVWRVRRRRPAAGVDAPESGPVPVSDGTEPR